MIQRSHFIALIGLLLVGAFVRQALAGARMSIPATVLDHEAHGSFGTVRNQSGTVPSYIGCTLTTSGISYQRLDCYAAENDLRDADHYGYCYSYDPNIIAAFAALRNGADIAAVSWDTSGMCTRLLVETASMYESERP